MEEKKTYKTLLLVALILGILAAIYDIVVVVGTLVSGSIYSRAVGDVFGATVGESYGNAVANSSMSIIGASASFATLLLLPSMIALVAAIVLSAMARSRGKASLALAAAILYSVSFVLGINVLTLASAILCYVAYGQIHGSQNKDGDTNTTDSSNQQQVR